MQTFNVPVLALPEPPTDPTNKIAFFKWKRNYVEVEKQMKTWEEANQRAYNLFRQHATPGIKSKIEAMPGFEAAATAMDGITLLGLFRSVCHQHDDTKQGTMTVVQTDKRAFLYYQKPSQSNVDYLAEFKLIQKVIETYEGSIGEHKGFIKQKCSDLGFGPAPDPLEIKKATVEVKKEYLTCLFISGADNTRYKQLKNELENNHLKGKDSYPKTYDEEMKMMENYKPFGKRMQQPMTNEGGVAFAQQGRGGRGGGAYRGRKQQPDKDKGVKPEDKPKRKNSKGETKCFNCGGEDHWVDKCPQLTDCLLYTSDAADE